MDFLTRQFIAFKWKFRSELKNIRDILESIRQYFQHQAEVDGNADHRGELEEVPSPIIVSIPESIEIRKHSGDKESDDAQHFQNLGIQTSIRNIQRWTLAAVCAYATVAIFQWCEMKKATDAARGTLGEAQKQTRYLHDQLVGTQQAILVLDLANRTGGDDPNSFFGFDISVVNNGHIATSAHVSLVVGRKKLPNLENFGVSKSITWDIPQIPAAGDDGHQKIRPFHTLDIGIAPQRWLDMLNFTKTDTVHAEGEITFDNGFGDNIRLPFCKIFYAHPTVLNSSKNGWVPCEEYRDTLKEWADRDQRAAYQAK